MKSLRSTDGSLLLDGAFMNDSRLLDLVATAANEMWERLADSATRFTVNATTRAVFTERVAEAVKTCDDPVVQYVWALVTATEVGPYGPACKVTPELSFGYTLVVGIALDVPFSTED